MSEGYENMKVIGLTGGVGSGKSTVLGYLQSFDGVKVIEADKVGHLMMEPGTECFDRIRAHFGKGVLGEDGRINRKALGDIVYADKAQLAYLNHLIHPAVKRYIREEIAAARTKGDIHLFVIEAALLIEDHYDEICDELWYVYADEGTRIARLKASRGYSDEKCACVMGNQLSDEEFRRHCDETIDNSGTRGDVSALVDELLKKKGISVA